LQFLNRILEGRWLLYIGLLTLAVGLPFSRALISIAPGILGGYWLFDGLYRKDFKQKLARLRTNKAALLFISFFIAYLIGGLYSDDGGRALKIIVNKLPWLVFPLIIASSEPLPAKNWRVILIIHIAAVLASTGCSYVNLHSMQIWLDPKAAILFVNHIRLSLMLVLGIISVVFLAWNSSRLIKLLALVVSMWAIYFMATFEIVTGLAITLFLTLGMGVYAIRYPGYRRILGLASIVLAFGAISYVWNVGAEQLKKPVRTDLTLEPKTALGNEYRAQTDNDLTENGYYVWEYVAADEMRDAWNSRSIRQIDPNIQKDIMFEGGLIRYLTSKGLRKDAQGVASLSQEDIANIESGHPSIVYSQYSGIRKRVYMLFYELDAYLNGGNPSLSSMTIKWEYWRAGLQLIQENPVLGVGTGDVRSSFEAQQAKEGRISPDSYDKAHNQYITWFVTFGILGAIYLLYAFLKPLFAAKSQATSWAVILIYAVFLISFLSEDTMENQLGLNLFLFYAMLFIIVPNQESAITSS
jgi:hypothetical protein